MPGDYLHPHAHLPYDGICNPHSRESSPLLSVFGHVRTRERTQVPLLLSSSCVPHVMLAVIFTQLILSTAQYPFVVAVFKVEKLILINRLWCDVT